VALSLLILPEMLGLVRFESPKNTISPNLPLSNKFVSMSQGLIGYVAVIAREIGLFDLHQEFIRLHWRALFANQKPGLLGST
jgi:hypothetical protein